MKNRKVRDEKWTIKSFDVISAKQNEYLERNRYFRETFNVGQHHCKLNDQNTLNVKTNIFFAILIPNPKVRKLYLYYYGTSELIIPLVKYELKMV